MNKEYIFDHLSEKADMLDDDTIITDSVKYDADRIKQLTLKKIHKKKGIAGSKKDGLILLSAAVVLLLISVGAVVSAKVNDGSVRYGAADYQSEDNYKVKREGRGDVEQLYSKEEEKALKDFMAHRNELYCKYAEEIRNNNIYDKNSEYYEEAVSDAATEKAMVEIISEILEFNKEKGHTSPEKTIEIMTNDRISYYEFLIECCDTYNDISYEMTMYERVRISWFLNLAYYLIEDEQFPELVTDEKTANEKRYYAKELIEKTIRPQFGKYDR